MWGNELGMCGKANLKILFYVVTLELKAIASFSLKKTLSKAVNKIGTGQQRLFVRFDPSAVNYYFLINEVLCLLKLCCIYYSLK